MDIVNFHHNGVHFYFQPVEFCGTKTTIVTLSHKNIGISSQSAHQCLTVEQIQDLLRFNHIVRDHLCKVLDTFFCISENARFGCRIGYQLHVGYVKFALLGTNVTLHQINNINVWVSRRFCETEFLEANYHSLDFMVIPRLDSSQIFDISNNIHTILEYILHKTQYVSTIRKYLDSIQPTIVFVNAAILEFELDLYCASIQIISNFSYGAQLQSFFRVGCIQSV